MFIFFDFGGTLGHQGQRQRFIYGQSKHLRLSALKPDCISTLKWLKRRGHKLGILSNTGFTKKEMKVGLQKAGMYQLFDCLVYSSDVGMCSKPCSKIFKTAQRCAGVSSPKDLLYVGDNYEKDIIAAQRLGWNTAYITNDLISYFFAVTGGAQTYALQNLSDLKTVLL